jgi:hypothetical protein
MATDAIIDVGTVVERLERVIARAALAADPTKGEGGPKWDTSVPLEGE